jgi:hypothetical protein
LLACGPKLKPALWRPLCNPPQSPVKVSRCHKSQLSAARCADAAAGKPGIAGASAGKTSDNSRQVG